MPNFAPIFSKVARNGQANNLTAANTAKDGTGTVNVVFTADATSGSYLQKIVVRPLGANVATVIRVFLNNGATNTVAANNTLIFDATLAATANSEVASIGGIEIPINVPLAPGYRIHLTLGTAVAAGFAVTAFGGDY